MSNGQHVAFPVAHEYMVQKRGGEKNKSKSCSPVECDLGILLLLDCFLIFASRDWRHDVVSEMAVCLLEGRQKDRTMKMDI